MSISTKYNAKKYFVKLLKMNSAFMLHLNPNEMGIIFNSVIANKADI